LGVFPENPCEFAVEFIRKMRNHPDIIQIPSSRQVLSIPNLIVSRYYRKGSITPNDFIDISTVTSFPDNQNLAKEIAFQILFPNYKKNIMHSFFVDDEIDTFKDELINSGIKSELDKLQDLIDEIETTKSIDINMIQFLEQFMEDLNEKRMPKKATLFDQICKAIDWWLENRIDDWDTMVIDDVSNSRKAAMFKGFEINQLAGLSKAQSKTELHGVPMPGIQDFGQEMNIMQWFVESYIEILEEAKKNFLVLAHERYTFSKPKDSKGNVIIGDKDIIDGIRPAFVGRTMPDDITTNFDEVWHLTKIGSADSAIVKLDCYGNDQILANTRHAGILKSFEKNPNFKEIMERIRKSQGK